MQKGHVYYIVNARRHIYALYYNYEYQYYVDWLLQTSKSYFKIMFSKSYIAQRAWKIYEMTI